jgi:hypothetical protein
MFSIPVSRSVPCPPPIACARVTARFTVTPPVAPPNPAVSRPYPPFSVSLPTPPVSRSLPAPPTSTLAAALPVSTSA